MSSPLTGLTSNVQSTNNPQAAPGTQNQSAPANPLTALKAAVQSAKQAAEPEARIYEPVATDFTLEEIDDLLDRLVSTQVLIAPVNDVVKALPDYDKEEGINLVPLLIEKRKDHPVSTFRCLGHGKALLSTTPIINMLGDDIHGVDQIFGYQPQVAICPDPALSVGQYKFVTIFGLASQPYVLFIPEGDGIYNVDAIGKTGALLIQGIEHGEFYYAVVAPEDTEDIFHPNMERSKENDKEFLEIGSLAYQDVEMVVQSALTIGNRIATEETQERNEEKNRLRSALGLPERNVDGTEKEYEDDDDE